MPFPLVCGTVPRLQHPNFQPCRDSSGSVVAVWACYINTVWLQLVTSWPRIAPSQRAEPRREAPAAPTAGVLGPRTFAVTWETLTFPQT